MLVKGLGKHLARNPVPDSEIRDALQWALDMIHTVLGDEEADVEAQVADFAKQLAPLASVDDGTEALFAGFAEGIASDLAFSPADEAPVFEPLFPPVSVSPDVIEEGPFLP